ncbi:hypothetical protein OG21DRAFT_1483954 [Imleria badia]|nr:hypothetical protein OG21DRAFT_1483954 [Imleria badia]
MHHALQIQEILLNVFGYCRLPTWSRTTSNLPALARTCRAFKEPALDVLWENLLDPSPLARCLPEASHIGADKLCYSFSRSLTRIEWSILRSYTRRIRSMLDDNHELDWESVRTFLNPPISEPLFPNLRDLHANAKSQHFFCMPFPSLISLQVRCIAEETLRALQGSLESFSKFSPNLRRFSIRLREPDITFSKFLSSYISRWRDLQTVDCIHFTLDVDTLVHLSRMPALTELSCTLSVTFPPSDSPLFFTNLHDFSIFPGRWT